MPVQKPATPLRLTVYGTEERGYRSVSSVYGTLPAPPPPPLTSLHLFDTPHTRRCIPLSEPLQHAVHSRSSAHTLAPVRPTAPCSLPPSSVAPYFYYHYLLPTDAHFPPYARAPTCAIAVVRPPPWSWLTSLPPHRHPRAIAPCGSHCTLARAFPTLRRARSRARVECVATQLPSRWASSGSVGLLRESPGGDWVCIGSYRDGKHTPALLMFANAMTLTAQLGSSTLPGT